MKNVKAPQARAKTRPYIPLKDTRRYSDGVRLHEFVGLVLSAGANMLANQTGLSISHTEFGRAAIPVLKKLGLIVLVDPKSELPAWLPTRERKLAKRGGGNPIWMPTPDFSFDALDGTVVEICDGTIVWTKIRLPKRLRKKTVH